MVRIRGDKLLQPTDCFLVVAIFEVLSTQTQAVPSPCSRVVEGFACVQDDPLFPQVASAAEQQAHVEVRGLSVEKFLQQRECVGMGVPPQAAVGQEICEGAGVRRAGGPLRPRRGTEPACGG